MKPNSLFKGKYTKKALFAIVPVILCAIIVCVFVVSMNDRNVQTENGAGGENLEIMSSERGDEEDMDKLYERINFENAPSTKTPLNEENLNKIDSAIDKLDNRAIELNGDLCEIDKRFSIINLFNPATITEGCYVSPNGGLDVNADFFASDYIYVGDLENIVISLTHRVSFYDNNKAFLSNPDMMNSYNSDLTIPVPTGASYLRFSTSNSYLYSCQIGNNVSRTEYHGYGEFYMEGLKGFSTSEEFENVNNKFEPFNLFDPKTITPGHYVAPEGTLDINTDFFASDFIYVGNLESVVISYTHRVSFYDSSKNFHSNPSVMNSYNSDVTVVIPEGAEYLRFSAENVYLNICQIGKRVARGNYKPYGKYALPDLIIETEEVTVSKSGNGDYTSLLRALYETDKNIRVVDGVVDVAAEYKEMFGEGFFEVGFDRTASGNFSLGLWVDNRTITFEAGTEVHFDLTDYDVSWAEGNDRRFCIMNIGSNVTIKGMRAYGTKNWYVIHDDGGLDFVPYENRFVDCVIIAKDIVNNNAIGGGMKQLSTTILDGCYIDDGTNNANNRTIRYHNTDWGNATPRMYVKNTFVNGCMFFGYLGEQTSIGVVTVNNCSMGSSIDVSAQVEGASENLVLYEWCNTIRN